MNDRKFMEDLSKMSIRELINLLNRQARMHMSNREEQRKLFFAIDEVQDRLDNMSSDLG